VFKIEKEALDEKRAEVGASKSRALSKDAARERLKGRQRRGMGR